MSWRFNPPPTWPAPPAGWTPPEGWAPDPSWPPAPPGWQFWVQEADAPWGQPPRAGSPTPTAPPPQSKRSRGPGRTILLIVLAMVAIGLIWGAIASVSLATRHSQDLQLTTESTTSNVRVDNECGPISLREGPAGVVTTDAKVKYSWRIPTVTSRLDGDVVAVEVDCPALGIMTSVTLVVQVPPNGSVEARSSAGSVKAEGLSSDLDLGSSAGSITATGLTSTTVVADTSAGSVSLTWSGDAGPTAVEATSSAGSVRVLVPDVAGVAYDVEADSSAGSVTVDVRTDPSSERRIKATSSAGSVLVAYQ
jgi:hypothetical protein